MNFDYTYLKEVAHKIFNTMSPSGYTQNVMNVIKGYVDELGFKNHLKD